MLNLRRVVERNVRIIRMIRRVILMISLGRVKGLEWHYLRHDWPRENFGLIELSNVGFGNLLLFVATAKNHGEILRAAVRPLPVELRRVVRHGKENAQQFAITN